MVHVQNGTSGDWLVHCGLDRDPQLIGRFPRSLFTGGFAEKAVGVLFGGVVAAPLTNPAPMGSGYLPTDVKSAASISNIQLIDQDQPECLRPRSRGTCPRSRPTRVPTPSAPSSTGSSSTGDTSNHRWHEDACMFFFSSLYIYVNKYKYK